MEKRKTSPASGIRPGRDNGEEDASLIYALVQNMKLGEEKSRLGWRAMEILNTSAWN